MYPVPGGGHMSKFIQGCSSYFWVWNLAKSYFAGLVNSFSYFSGFHKISATFLGLTNFQLFFWVFQFLYHTIESFEWRPHSTGKHKIIVAFHIYSNFDKHSILTHSIFFYLNFGAFYFLGSEIRVILFFGVVEICSRTSIPVKEVLLSHPPPPLLGSSMLQQIPWLEKSFLSYNSVSLILGYYFARRTARKYSINPRIRTSASKNLQPKIWGFSGMKILP